MRCCYLSFLLTRSLSFSLSISHTITHIHNLSLIRSKHNETSRSLSLILYIHSRAYTSKHKQSMCNNYWVFSLPVWRKRENITNLLARSNRWVFIHSTCKQIQCFSFPHDFSTCVRQHCGTFYGSSTGLTFYSVSLFKIRFGKRTKSTFVFFLSPSHFFVCSDLLRLPDVLAWDSENFAKCQTAMAAVSRSTMTWNAWNFFSTFYLFLFLVDIIYVTSTTCSSFSFERISLN